MFFRWLTPLLLLFLSGISGIAFASVGLGSSGHKYLPPASFTPSYDLDGNPLDDGEWSYTWDAENRLTTATSRN